MNKMTVLSLAFVILAPLSASAGVYRWIDTNGNVVFSDTRPAGGATRVAPPPPASSSHRNLADDYENEMSKMHRETPRPQVKPDDQHRQQCENARKNLDLLNQSQAGDRFNTADGEEIKFTADELAKQIRENEMAERAYCQ